MNKHQSICTLQLAGLRLGHILILSTIILISPASSFAAYSEFTEYPDNYSDHGPGIPTEYLQRCPITKGFDFPVGKPNGRGYYNAQKFKRNNHLGDDWNGIKGGNSDLNDPIYAIADGIVTYARLEHLHWGRVIRIIHNKGTADKPDYVESIYAHVRKVLVKPGMLVRRGQKIATIGTANGAYLAHLHLEIRTEINKPLGVGYSKFTSGYVDPTRFIKSNRPPKRSWTLIAKLKRLKARKTKKKERIRFIDTLINAALQQTRQAHYFDGRYQKLSYPLGDILPSRSSQADLIVRAYQNAGVDLQQQIHHDISKHFSVYPVKPVNGKPDRNIDHRRIENMETFFHRNGQRLSVSKKPENYQPGDVVVWTLINGLRHIGLVSNKKSPDNRRYLIIHNIGPGPKAEDILFEYNITGHYRYFGPTIKLAKTVKQSPESDSPTRSQIADTWLSGLPTFTQPLLKTIH